MPISKKNFIIDPVNNVTGQEFSFKNGQPTVKFSIPSVELMLETSNLRLSGQVYIKNATGSQITQSGYNTQLQVNENGTEQLMSDATKCNMQNFAGVHNLIKSIVIESKKAKIELVNDSIYPTHSALRQANKYGEDDFKRIPLTQSLASGIHADKLSRHLNIVGGSTAMPVSLRGNYFSIKLGEGLFEGYPLHLGREYLSGLNITIYLNNDSTSVFSRWNNPTSEDDSVENFSYVLKNLKLAGRYIQPTAQE